MADTVGSVELEIVNLAGETIVKRAFNPCAKVSDVKAKVAKMCGISAECQELRWANATLEENTTLESLGLPSQGAVIEMLISEDAGVWEPDLSLWVSHEVRSRTVNVPMAPPHDDFSGCWQFNAVPVGRGRLLVYADQYFFPYQPGEFWLVGAEEETAAFDPRPSPEPPFVGVQRVPLPLTDAWLVNVAFDGTILTAAVSDQKPADREPSEPYTSEGADMAPTHWFRLESKEADEMSAAHFEVIEKPRGHQYHDFPHGVHSGPAQTNGLKVSRCEEVAPATAARRARSLYGQTLHKARTGEELGRILPEHDSSRDTIHSIGPNTFDAAFCLAVFGGGEDACSSVLRLFDWNTGEQLREIGADNGQGYIEHEWPRGMLAGKSQTFFTAYFRGCRGGEGYWCVAFATPDPESYSPTLAEQLAEQKVAKQEKEKEKAHRLDLVEKLFTQPFAQEVSMIEQTIRFCEGLAQPKGTKFHSETKPSGGYTDESLPSMMRTLSGVSELVAVPRKEDESQVHHVSHGKKGHQKHHDSSKNVHHTAETLYFFSQLGVNAPMSTDEVPGVLEELAKELQTYKTKLDAWKAKEADREAIKVRILQEGYIPPELSDA